MRESPKYERTHLPPDSYEEWINRQIEKARQEGPNN
jgi:hypothetical protein